MPNLRTFMERGLAQTRRYGPGLLMHRYWTRKGILKSPPVECPEGAELEVHTMLCQRDWLNGLWALKSFRAFAGKPFRLVIVEDGSLSPDERRCMLDHFPGARMPGMDEVAPLVEERLAPIAPRITEWWKARRWFILRKTIDSWVLAGRRYLLKIDPDVMFFKRPDEMLTPEETLGGKYAAFNVHRHGPHRLGMYCVDPELLQEKYGINLPTTFNEGLGIVDTSKTDWPLVERIFNELPIVEENLFLAAQTIEGIWGMAHGLVELPTHRYNVEWDDTPVDGETVARHYLSKMRDRLYVEAIPRLSRDPVARKFVRG